MNEICDTCVESDNSIKTVDLALENIRATTKDKICNYRKKNFVGENSVSDRWTGFRLFFVSVRLNKDKWYCKNKEDLPLVSRWRSHNWKEKNIYGCSFCLMSGQSKIYNLKYGMSLVFCFSEIWSTLLLLGPSSPDGILSLCVTSPRVYMSLT